MHNNLKSAETCGCDPGIGWYCAQHKFKEQVAELITYFRNKAAEYADDDLASAIYTDCADKLEEKL